MLASERPCHGSGGQSHNSHCGYPRSIPGQAMWYLRCTKLQRNRVFSESFCFAPPISLHQCCLLVSHYKYLIPGRQKSETWGTSKYSALSETTDHWEESHFHFFFCLYKLLGFRLSNNKETERLFFSKIDYLC